MTQECYKRQWWVQEKPRGYLVNLCVGNYEINDFIDRIHWEESMCSVDLLRTTINRLQRKMVDVIFPTYRGRFNCDWDY